MELLKKITDLDLGISRKGPAPKEYRIRRAARAVILDNGKIALVNASKCGIHKIPGGGIKEGESIEEALRREIREEAGCEINILGEIGIIEEERDSWALRQISYCFLAKKKGKQHELSLTKKEKDQGFMLEWVSLGEAVKLMESDKPDGYGDLFKHKRDFTLLLKAREIILKQG